MLIPEPLVPLGRGLTAAEAAHIAAWLDEDARRLAVLDCVYTFGARFTPAATTLLARGQTIVLHSLAKAFLAPEQRGSRWARSPPCVSSPTRALATTRAPPPWICWSGRPSCPSSWRRRFRRWRSL